MRRFQAGGVLEGEGDVGDRRAVGHGANLARPEAGQRAPDMYR